MCIDFVSPGLFASAFMQPREKLRNIELYESGYGSLFLVKLRSDGFLVDQDIAKILII